ncbi:MAG: MFS transporter [Candidatus Eremiobacteraeota bacterium]|nr:MFS transporter [Candidatus Eremiobacteraeota bacterium]
MWKNLIFLAIGMFAVGCNTFLFAGLLPQIGQTIGQTVAVTGQGTSIYSLTYLFSAPVFSMFFADKPAKKIIQLALGLFLLGSLITVLSQNFAVFLIGRSLAGVGAGIFTPLCISIALHFADASSKGRVLSFVWGASSAGVVFGIPIGLRISSLSHWQSSILYLMTLGAIALIGFSLQTADIKLPESPSLGERLKLLIDPKTLSVIAVSCFTATASLGLYSYVSLIQSGSANSLSMTLFSWGLGGFIGSSMIGTFTDRTKNPRATMAIILLGLILAFVSIPFTKNLPYLGLIPFFMWGLFGWAITTPQQQILVEGHENKGAILAALNSSALGFGSALGTLLGGSIVSAGLKGADLPFPSATLLLFVFIGQLILVRNSNKVKA